jgi:release factor glutamine methyltransferase
VLIPRPETELIVEEALAWMGAGARPAPVRVLDIGTGSGCLAVTLALELPGVQVRATDISVLALETAQANGRRLGAEVEFHHGAFLAGTAGPYDLIVSNPPYVTTADYRDLQPEVRDHEPPEALLGGPDGLEVLGEVVRQAAHALARDGALLMEIGYGQATAIRKTIADTKGVTLLRIRDDLSGIPRVAVVAAR